MINIPLYNFFYPLQSLALFFVGTIGSSMLCYATPYTSETMPAKLGTFALFTSVMGVTLAPLIAMAGMLQLQYVYIKIYTLLCAKSLHFYRKLELSYPMRSV